MRSASPPSSTRRPLRARTIFHRRPLFRMPSRTTERPSRSKEPSRISARVKRSATADLYQRHPGPALTRPGSQVWGFPANTYAAHSIAADVHSARSAHKGDISEYLRNLGDRLSSLYSEYPERGAIDDVVVARSAVEPQPHASATDSDQPVPTECAKRYRFVVATQKRDRIGA